MDAGALEIQIADALRGTDDDAIVKAKRQGKVMEQKIGAARCMERKIAKRGAGHSIELLEEIASSAHLGIHLLGHSVRSSLRYSNVK